MSAPVSPGPVLAFHDAEQQRWLFRANRRVLDAGDYARLRAVEDDLMVAPAAARERSAPDFPDAAALLSALAGLLADEASGPPTAAEAFLADRATVEQFRVLAAQYAVDGLIESQSHLAVLPRLPAAARMAVLRVLIDEFGCGQESQEHSRLYRDLLEELGLPTDVEHHVDGARPAVLGFVNLFFWLAARAPAPEYFLGAYAYFESSVLHAFRPFAAAAARLGVVHHEYFTEHLYIDSYHSRQMQTAVAAMERAGAVGLAKVWAGVELASAAAAGAFEAAVAAAADAPADAPADVAADVAVVGSAT